MSEWDDLIMENGYFYWDKANQFGGDPIEKDEDDDSYNLEDPLFDDDVKFMGGFVPNNQ